jgi:hypothetical protein
LGINKGDVLNNNIEGKQLYHKVHLQFVVIHNMYSKKETRVFLGTKLWAKLYSYLEIIVF